MIRLLFLLCLPILLIPAAFAHETHAPASKYVPPSEKVVLGQGAFRYELIPGWATHNKDIRLPHCHAIAPSSSGQIYLLVNDPENCVIVLDPSGTVIKRWGGFTKSAHGLAIVWDGKQQHCFITDNSANGAVYKTTLDGEVVMKVTCPMASKLYDKPEQFKPSKTIHLAGGDFLVLDGYGKDFVHRFKADGTYVTSWGGNIGEGEAELKHWGPHGGNASQEHIILALSDQQKLKLFSHEGKYKQTIPMPGSNPRDVVFHRDHIWIPHLGDAWPKDRNAGGFISVLDEHFKVVANLGGTAPAYDGDTLQHMAHDGHVFHHPHGMCFDWQGNLYVAQFASNGTWPLKFQPVPTKPPVVRYVYLVPKGTEAKPEYVAAIKGAAVQVQEWLAEKMDGKTYTIGEPAVEIVQSELSFEQFEGERIEGVQKGNWGFMHAFQELRRVKGEDAIVPHETVWVVYSGGRGNSGRAYPGFVYLPENDLLGLVGNHPTQKDPDRWKGGLMHELGHGLGLRHPLDRKKHASAIMWAGFYGKYPDKGAYLTAFDAALLQTSPFLKAAQASD